MTNVAKKKPVEPLPPKNCGVCKGAPYIPGPNGGMGRCGSCERGRELARRDRERGIRSELITPAVRPQAGFEGDWS